MEKTGLIRAVIGDVKLNVINHNKKAYILEDLSKRISKKKIIEALSMVNLNEDYLLKKTNDLSDSEYNKLLFVKDLLNKNKNITLEFFERGLCSKERTYFKRLLKKLAKEYTINFNIITNDLTFCIGLVDEFAIYEDNNLVKTFDKSEIYDEELYDYFDRNQLFYFVTKSRNYGHLYKDYYDIKDVLKAVYRELE